MPDEDAVLGEAEDEFIEPAEFEAQDVETYPGGDPEAEAEVEKELPVFDEQYHEDFRGLLYIGKVIRSFKWMGHTFKIRTPFVSELLEIGLLHRPYIGTLSDIKAYQSLVLAAVLISVDGKSLPLPIEDTESQLEAKANYINAHWYPWTTDAIYQQYMILDSEIQQVIENMGKASGATNSTPS